MNAWKLKIKSVMSHDLLLDSWESKKRIPIFIFFPHFDIGNVGLWFCSISSMGVAKNRN